MFGRLRIRLSGRIIWTAAYVASLDEMKGAWENDYQCACQPVAYKIHEASERVTDVD